MMRETHDSDADAMIRVAARAGAQWLGARGLVGSVDRDAFTAALKREIVAVLPTALSDARAALNAGMTAVAEQTFAASLALAGIAAARSVAPAGVRP